MKNQILRVSVKFGLILAAVNLVVGLINTFMYDPENFSQTTLVSKGMISFIITFVITVVFLAFAHYEFNNKNGNYIAFKDAICIGLLVIGISYLITSIYNIISYEFFLKEKVQSQISNMSEQYGGNLISTDFNLTWSFLTFFIGLLIQIVILFYVIIIESYWKIFKKAGEKGWAILIPIYNIIVLLRIVNKPAWWLLLLLIPIVNVVISIWIVNLLSKRFGKDEGYTVGLIFLPFVFYPLLGMSKQEIINE